MKPKLNEIRERIDTVDKKVLRLLNERAQLARDVGEAKSRSESDDQPTGYRPEREAQVMARVRRLNEGPLTDAQVEVLYREIISCCRSLEQPLTVVYLGPPGTYTEAAAIRQFGHFAKARPVATIPDVFQEVENGSSHFGVVPVENSTEGMVNHTLDCFMESSLRICGEVALPIHHAFMTARGADPEKITLVYSHAQSLAQCRLWLEQNFPKLENRAVSSNAEAARLASENPEAAAIAGELAAEQFQLTVVQTNIEDQSDNTTRFLIVGDQDVDPCGSDKTSILVSTADEPGALYRVLAPFYKKNISLSRIETRPARFGNWTYVFFIDFDGHQSRPEIASVLADVANVSMDVRSLGSYPKAVE